MGQKWWFAPEIIEKNVNLLSNATEKIPGSEKIEKAEDVSVFLRKVYINKPYEGKAKFWKKDTNDLLITTRFQTGTSPIIQRVHKYAPNRKIGFAEDFFKTIVCSFQDYTSHHLTLHTQIYDVDNYKDFKNNLEDFTNLVGETGVFTAITPYIGPLSKIANSFVNLLEKLDTHDAIIDERLKLEIIEENMGSKILQTGHWVCFSEEQEEGNMLTPNLRVVFKDDETECSYVVYTVRKMFDEEPEWEISQKLATLLTELQGKGESGKPAVSFLRDTMNGYNKFRKLERIKELEKKKDSGDFTNEEGERLEKLKKSSDLKPYRPP